ncbi:DUF2510 domain-containing protein, partial [Mycobacterium alsense]|uniref:DUF2510 domain-containing protein n=1 Tax=Mycobacterium alsense TaxID=324058 RepID=UPI0011522477
MSTPQPGWYDDPENSNAQRYWDGQNWTPQRQRKDTTPTAPDHAAAAKMIFRCRGCADQNCRPSSRALF